MHNYVGLLAEEFETLVLTGHFLLVILVTDRETRKSRGFGYVVFGSEREAKEAMNSMSGERGKVGIYNIPHDNW